MGIMEVDMVVMVLVAVMIVDMMVRRGMAMCGGDGDHGSEHGSHLVMVAIMIVDIMVRMDVVMMQLWW